MFEGVTKSSSTIISWSCSALLPRILSLFLLTLHGTTSVDDAESSLDDPTSLLASTPLSADVQLATSIRSCWSFDACKSPDDDATLVDEELGLGESFSKECVESGDEVIELKAFVVMNIFGVIRPLKVSLFAVDESGLGHIGNGDEPRL